MTLAHPDLLLIGAIVAALALFAGWRQARRRAVLRDFLGGRTAISRLSAGARFRPGYRRFGLLSLAALAFATAAAEPTWRTAEQPPAPTVPAREVLLGIDVSASMQAADVSPTRLAGAVELARRVVGELEGERVGLLVYAAQPYLLAPPTADHRPIHYLLDGITPTIASAHDPGTLPSLAIGAAIDLLPPDEEREAIRTFVVLTDGGAGEPRSAVIAAAERARNAGIVVRTIGFGSAGGAGMVMPRAPFQLGGPILDSTGAPARSRLDEGLMRSVSSAGGGSYTPAADAAAVDALLRELRRPPLPPPPAAPARSRWSATDPGFLLIALGGLCLLLEALFDARVPRLAPLPRRRLA